jgi:nitric oxide reductase activation protein
MRLLDDADRLDGIEQLLSPLRCPGASPADTLTAAGTLYSLVAPVWAREGADSRELDTVDVPYPPFYDHFLLSLKLSSLAPASTGDSLPAGRASSGDRLDVPASLHPSEVIEGLEILLRDKATDEELLLTDDDEEEDDSTGVHEVFTYDEWDYEVGDHRTKWCTVRCRELPPGDPSFVYDTIERYKGEVHLIRRQFERLRPDRIKRYFRQVEGDELDLDALTEALVDRAAGAPMTDKLFVRRDKKRRDVAVLFLLDMSDSTDQLVEEERRIIDVEKEGLVLLAEAIGQLDDEYAIMGFTSRGRKLVDLYEIKQFDEDFNQRVWSRIGGIQPLDYTRLGAAIRHATSHLAERPAAARLLVLLSDGRPYDMGYGDMRYATEDTKMALAEARRLGINAFCITVDPKGPDYLEDLFGANRYTVIQHVGHLPTKLPRIYRNLTM